ncbi:MAG: LysE/ArgO family amino acid transporter [Pseudomonadota bacterium]
MVYALTQGFLLGFSLILAIGAQNALILRYGLIKRFVWQLCLICAVSDSILIALGVLGLGRFIQSFDGLKSIMVWIGVIWLCIYGLLRLRDAYLGWRQNTKATQHTKLAQDQSPKALRGVIILCLLLTWGNPHVYLDTIILIGSLANIYAMPQNWFFAIGAIIASFVFFFSLGYGARILAPLMQHQYAWIIFDSLTALIMFSIAGLLLFKHLL